MLRFDPDVLGLGATHTARVVKVALSDIEESGQILNRRNLTAISASFNASEGFMDNVLHVRRLNALGSTRHPSEADWDGLETHLFMVFAGLDTHLGADGDQGGSTAVDQAVVLTFPLADNFGGARTADNNDSVGVVIPQTVWGLEDDGGIPEIDIKVDSVAVTAVTKKLKAKWTPELGQDLNAYHNLDAEVELTSVLSEHIALEIDREILNDLIQGATAGTLYWSRSPGLFVNRETGAEIGAVSAAPDFTGTVS